ncbi:MAG: TolC family protein [Candidatus Omnitrophota bacterium]|nr:TolC family protein [Candidatus Omnitrophota bacterium]MDZ4242678.1 TolC family protein [Candidatus Omnitrophota bacterium]
MLWPRPGHGQDPEEVLSLKGALAAAYQDNPQMVEARARIGSAQGDLLTVRTWLNPELEAEVGGLKKNEAEERRGHLDSISIKQPFSPVGVRYLQTKMARNDVLAQEEMVKLTWAAVYADVRGLFSQIVLDQQSIRLAEDNANALRQFFSNVQIRYQSGQVLKNDLNRAQIELRKAESESLAAQRNLKVNKAGLNFLLGRPYDRPFEIREELREESLSLDLEDLIRRAIAQRPDLKAQALQFDSSRKDVVRAELGRLPSFSLGFEKTDTAYDKDYAALVSINVPLWNLNQGDVRKARARRTIEETKTDALKREIGLEVYRLFLNAEYAQSQIHLLNQSLREANELLSLAHLRYREGKIGFTDYLDQVKTAAQAKVNYYEALYDLERSINSLEVAIYTPLRQEDFLHEKF